MCAKIPNMLLCLGGIWHPGLMVDFTVVRPVLNCWAQLAVPAAAGQRVLHLFSSQWRKCSVISHQPHF
jgi:hypothetical protein